MICQRGRRGDHAEPEDLRRRALELSRRLGLCRRQIRPRRGQEQGVRQGALRQCAGARHRRARLDHDLRPARHRRRAARLGERGLPRPRRAWRRQIRDRRAVALDQGGAAGRRGRQGRRRQGHAQSGRGLSRTSSIRPRRRSSSPSTTIVRQTRSRPIRRISRASSTSSSSRSTIRCSAGGQRRSRSTSPTAASSTRSTSRSRPTRG